MTRVEIFLNVGEEHYFGWKPGDPVVRVFAYETDRLATPLDLADEAFQVFNGHPGTVEQLAWCEAYYDRRLRSLSVGDVLIVGEVALACERLGWEVVTGDGINDITSSYDGDGSVVVALPRDLPEEGRA